ncbi:hypothetical protein [Amaricoccus tamworthensis]|uniref:hypothetical protein n=1 Tax=Amaricoccus tamworthensis TaxID=57002 RepID=UPI003C7CEF2C
MLDTYGKSCDPIDRVEVRDYVEMGKMVARWAMEPDTAPRDLESLRKALDGVAHIPNRYNRLEMRQDDVDTLVIQLPSKELVEEGINRTTDPMADCRYPMPNFYSDFYRTNVSPVMTPFDTLMARMGDSVTAECR